MPPTARDTCAPSRQPACSQQQLVGDRLAAEGHGQPGDDRHSEDVDDEEHRGPPRLLDLVRGPAADRVGERKPRERQHHGRDDRRQQEGVEGSLLESGASEADQASNEERVCRQSYRVGVRRRRRPRSQHLAGDGQAQPPEEQHQRVPDRAAAQTAGPDLQQDALDGGEHRSGPLLRPGATGPSQPAGRPLPAPSRRAPPGAPTEPSDPGGRREVRRRSAATCVASSPVTCTATPLVHRVSLPCLYLVRRAATRT